MFCQSYQIEKACYHFFREKRSSILYKQRHSQEIGSQIFVTSTDLVSSSVWALAFLSFPWLDLDNSSKICTNIYIEDTLCLLFMSRMLCFGAVEEYSYYYSYKIIGFIVSSFTNELHVFANI